MNNHIHWQLEVRIREGKQQEFRDFFKKMVDRTRPEPETLIYEWYFSSDGKICHIHERFADSQALLLHGENFGQHADEFFAITETIRMTVHGSPDKTARDAIAVFQPEYFVWAAGFNRFDQVGFDSQLTVES